MQLTTDITDTQPKQQTGSGRDEAAEADVWSHQGRQDGK